MLIEIDMLDAYRSLGAGRRIVEYIGIEDSRLLCSDTTGTRLRLPLSKFRFVRAMGHETRCTEEGVQVKVGEEWLDLGPLCRDARR